MSTLDNPNVAAPKTVSYQSTVLRYGVIGGLIFVIYGLLGNTLGFTRPSAGIGASILSLAIVLVLYVAIMVMGIRQHRDKELGGFISFGRAFIVAFLIAMVAAVITTIFNYAYFNFIEPDYFQNVSAEMEEMYAKFGLNEEQIEEAMRRAEKNFAPGRMVIMGIISNVIMGGIVAAIVGAIMKKNRPEVA